MQIGGRWPFGGTPPRGLPQEFLDEISRAEASASDAQRAASWTLTWLEGRPVAELDGGLRIGAEIVPGFNDDDVEDEDDDELFPEP